MYKNMWRMIFLLWVACGVWVGLAMAWGKTRPIAQLAYQSNRSLDHNLYLLDVPSGLTFQVTHHRAEDISPTWSPDGSALAFASNRPAHPNYTYIWIWSAKTNKLRRIALPKRMLMDYLAWSPNGQYIAFVGRGVDESTQDLYVLQLETAQLKRVTHTPSVHETRPSWSPNGEELAYATYDVLNNYMGKLYRIRFDPMGVVNVRQGAYDPVPISDHDGATAPFWVATDQVAFTYASEYFPLHITATDATAPDLPWLHLVGMIEDPALSPDQQWLAYSSAPNVGTTWRSLYLARVDGTHIQRVTFSSSPSQLFRDAAPTWRPSAPLGGS